MTASLEAFVHPPWRAVGATVVDSKGNRICDCSFSHVNGANEVLAIFIAGLPELYSAARAAYDQSNDLGNVIEGMLFKSLNRCNGSEVGQ